MELEIMETNEDLDAQECDHSRTDLTKVNLKRTWWGNARYFIKNITLEPLVFIWAVATTMQGVVIQALVKEKTCLVAYGYNEVYCLNVTNVSVMLELKGVVADFNVYTMVLETTPFIVFSLFAGAWSDQHGPKLLIFATLTTNIAASATFAVVSHLKYLGPEYILIGNAIRGISGFQMMFFLAILNYIVVNSSVKSRTTRITFIDTAYLTGAPIGYELGSWLYGNRNFTLVFLGSLIVFFMGVPYAVYSLWNLPMVVGPKSLAFRGIFKLHHLKTGFRVLVKKREGRQRFIIILLLICSILITFPSGDGSVFFPFAELVLKFTVEYMSFYNACFTAFVCIGTSVVLPLLSYVIGINDIIIGVIALFMLSVGMLWTAFSYSSLMLFLSTPLFIIAPAANIVCRSLMSQCVSQDEQGKLISVSGLLNAGIPIVASLVYDRIFRATMATVPGTCFMLSAAIYILPMIGFIWIYYDIRRHPVLHETKEQDEVILIENIEDQ